MLNYKFTTKIPSFHILSSTTDTTGDKIAARLFCQAEISPTPVPACMRPQARREGEGRGVSPGPATFGGPTIAQNILLYCVRQQN